jgi:hypothetical protein
VAGQRYVAFPREIRLDTVGLSRAPGANRQALDAVLKDCPVAPGQVGDGKEALSRAVVLRAVGLRREEYVRQDALRFPPGPLIAVLFLLFLPLLSLPFVKLFALKPWGERFGLGDGLFLFIGSLTAFALLVFAILLHLTQTALVRQDEKFLRDFSGKLASHFQQEEKAVRSQVTALEDHAAQHPPVTRHVKNVLAALAETQDKVPYPFFERAFFADSKGELTTYFTTGERNVPLPDINDRPYFQTVQKEKFAVEPINSWSTGERLTVFAQPAKPGSVHRLAAILTHTLSLERPLLPPGYGFAILDPQGKVLFHSDRGCEKSASRRVIPSGPRRSLPSFFQSTTRLQPPACRGISRFRWCETDSS